MSIKKYQDNGKTYYDVSVNVRSKVHNHIRKQKRRKHIESKAKAERIERQLYDEAYTEISQIDGEGFTWEQVVMKWYEYKKHDQIDPIGENTLTDYLSALKKWTSSFWTKPAKKVTRGDIKEVIRIMEIEKKSKSFISKLKGTINRVYIWGIEENLIKEVYQSPTFGVTVSRKSERVPTILNKEEILKLIKCAKEQNSPWFPIWAVALLTGCRNGELYALTWDDIDFENKKIRVSKSYNKRRNEIKSTKSGNWRNVPINQELELILRNLKDSSTSNHVLPRLREWRHGYQAKALRLFCKTIGITSIRFHDLRACFATQLLQNKVAPATVMKICGWKDLDTMARYIRVAGIDEEGATNCLNIL